MTFLASLLAPVWRWIAAAGAAIAAIGAVYLKGRADAKAKAKLEDITNANEIRKAGADARARADTAPDRLRADDGFRRD
ncbi:hypothetical protein Pam5_24 [Pseudanabaena phage Pam5]|nr:hypothetical protein Pam5_24 [Pseudanabaena phage Pam5]